MNKCSSKEHTKIDAIIYCKECNLFMCKKCENFHSNLFSTHHAINLDNNNEEISLGFCEEKDHNNNKLEFFCKTHN